MADIFREVDEDVRKERYVKLWRTYGRYAIGFAVAVALIVVGMSGWDQYRQSANEAESERFANAVSMFNSRNYTGAIEEFSQLGSEANSGYRELSLFREAASRTAAGNRDEAIAIYDGIAANSSNRKEFRDLSRLLAIMNILESPDLIVGSSDMSARLDSLDEVGSPWYYSARELAALIKLYDNDRNGALEEFAAIRDDIHAPPALRARSTELYESINDRTH